MDRDILEKANDIIGRINHCKNRILKIERLINNMDHCFLYVCNPAVPLWCGNIQYVGRRS